MSGRFFLDTNVLVYCFDGRSPSKQRTARQLVSRALESRLGLISWQVVQEFLNLATRKFARPMTPAEAGEYLDAVLSPLCEIFPSADVYKSALRVQSDTRYSFYDSLILAAALQGASEVVYSEDLQDGRVYGQLTIKNPFAE